MELADKEVIRGDIPLKPRSQWKYIGQQAGRLDAKAKSTGQAVYGIDVELPDMVYAVMTRSPRHGGVATRFNEDQVRSMSGVLDAFITERGVAVVADRYWRARKAQQMLEVEWDFSEAVGLSNSEVFEHYREAATEDPGVNERVDGDPEAVAETDGILVEAEYEQPYLAHAAMEPMNATAWYRDGGMEVWAPTQAPDLGRIAAARHTDLSPDEVTIHTTFLGGGFGRRLTQDYIEEAALVAYRMKVPVKLIWSREEDIRHGFYPARPCCIA